MSSKVKPGDKVKVLENAPEHVGREGIVQGFPAYIPGVEALCRIKDSNGEEFNVPDTNLKIIV
ncbi:MAG: hypothetical protein V3R96_07135 [Dehalococcoidales bacterium]